MRRNALILAMMLASGGCSLIPGYHRPDAPVPIAWDASAAQGEKAANVVNVDWRSFYLDPALQRLIDLSLENNRDLRKAILNVDAYRAQFNIQRAALAPDIGIDGSAGRSRTPGDLSSTGEHVTSGNNALGIGLTSYEVDLWGRVRSLNRSALETYLSSEETQLSVRIGLISDVAIAYMTWQADLQSLTVTRSTLENYEHNYSLVLAGNKVGTASNLDVRQARSLVDSARGDVQTFTRQVAQDRNALRVLLGSEIPLDIEPSGADVSGLADVPPGLPADLLLRRPDIRAAEHALLAANADIGAARAAFFPSITLTANAGSASHQLDGLFNNGSESWSFVPQIRLPIFNGGRLKASLEYAKIQKEVGVADYEKTIQVAFREVSDGLAGVSTWKEQLESQRDLVKVSEEYDSLAQQRFDEGVDSYLTVLDAQRQLLTARLKLISDKLAQFTSQVQLYKALGGGLQLAGVPVDLGKVTK